jgi:general nucleoside transport system permease protein
VNRRRILYGLLAPASAVAFSLLVSAVALLAIHERPLDAFGSMFRYSIYDANAGGFQTDSLASIINRAIPLYIAGLAVAIGFKMNLFNIGVEGQYRLAALMAAFVAGNISLPAPLHLTVVFLVALIVGSAWAGVAGVLKVTRGVHEVISTIMLNFIAIGLGQYLFANYFGHKRSAQDLILKTKEIRASGRFPSLFGLGGPTEDIRGFVVIAILLGIAFYLLVWRTRFGYDLRASGLNPDAARVSGVDPRAMVIKTMLISGAIAGLVGLSDLLGFFHQFSLDFPTQFGFNGIAVALIGRNNPIGVAIGALLFGFLDRSAQILDFEDIPREIIIIVQGIIILSVVVAYEVVRRIAQAQQVKAAAEVTKDRADRPVQGAPA